MLNTKRSKWLGCLLVASAIPLAVLASAGDGASTRAAAQASENQPPSNLTEVVDALRQPRSAADWLPATAVTEVQGRDAAGLDPNSSVLSLARGAWKLYLTPGDETVCVSIVDPDGGASASCRSSSDIEKGAALPAAVRQGCELASPDAAPVCTSALIYGVVPDGVDKVAVDVGSGPAPKVEVQRNAYLVQVYLDQRPTGVSYDGPNGRVVLPVPMS